ncbi:MAG: hypothetical protein ABWZ99_01055 [Ilumatobacteraceae bacterium]
MRHTTIPAAAAVLIALAVVSACGSDSSESGSGTPDRAIATFQVEAETFKVELITADLIANAQALLDGQEAPSIPVGKVVRDDPGPNSPWSWHIDPATVEFADMTTEVCDGLPSFEEEGIITSDIYCPWGAELIALDPL